MRRSRAVAFALGLGMVTMWAATPEPAHACGGFYQAVAPSPPPKPKVVKPKPGPSEAMAIAEPALLKEEPQVAATALAEGFPNLKVTSADASRQELRALRLMAISVARTDGAVTVAGPFYAASGAARAANLAWSIETLRKLNVARPNDPALQAELGEALARTPSGQDEAFQILGGLAASDLMGSAHGYAALARLRSAKGDAAGSADASERCRAMATAASICPAAPAATIVAARSDPSSP